MANTGLLSGIPCQHNVIMWYLDHYMNNKYDHDFVWTKEVFPQILNPINGFSKEKLAKLNKDTLYLNSLSFNLLIIIIILQLSLRWIYFPWTTYTGCGQFSGGSRRPPVVTNCITSWLPRPGYGIYPNENTSQSSIPKDLKIQNNSFLEQILLANDYFKQSKDFHIYAQGHQYHGCWWILNITKTTRISNIFFPLVLIFDWEVCL